MFDFTLSILFTFCLGIKHDRLILNILVLCNLGNVKTELFIVLMLFVFYFYNLLTMIFFRLSSDAS